MYLPREFSGEAYLPLLQREEADFWLELENESRTEFSRVASYLLDRPILVVNPADIPFNPRKPPVKADIFNKYQLKVRAVALKKMAMAALPQFKDIWDEFEWSALGSFYDPTISYLGTNGVTKDKLKNIHSHFSSRLKGRFWKKAAVIFCSDRRWSIDDEYQRLIPIDPVLLKNLPTGRGVKFYLFLHELNHILQLLTRCHKLNHAQAWLTEYDADNGAFKRMLRAANRPGIDPDLAEDLKATVATMKHIRALTGFISGETKYWIAPALADQDWSNVKEAVWSEEDKVSVAHFPVPLPCPQACRLAGYELRVRVADHLAGRPVRSSDELQTELKAWIAEPLPSDRAEGERFQELNDLLYSKPWPLKWRDYDIRELMPALERIYKTGEISNPITKLNAKLVLDAATELCPDVFSNVKEETPQIVPQNVRLSAEPSLECPIFA